MAETKESRSIPNGTVVVIVKNAESSVRKCMESLLAQTMKCEIVVVDGNSTDRTRDILREFPVKVISAPEIDSYGISRNLGVKNSNGTVILFMDADDLAEPIWAEALLKHFDGASNVGIVNVPRRVDKFEGWFMKTLAFEYAAQSQRDERKEQGLSWASVTTKGTAWLKKAIHEAGGFDEAMYFGTEDKDLSYRIWRLGYLVEEEPSARIIVSSVGGARNFVKDKFWRAGVGHGYLRRKLGLYRPPAGGITSVAFVVAGLILLVPFRETLFALFSFILAILASRSVVAEGYRLRVNGAPLLDSMAFTIVKWFSRVAEFLGFTVGYLGYSGRKTSDPMEIAAKGEAASVHA